MERLILQRGASTDQGTLGMLMHEQSRFCYTIELPWRNNARRKSCIPPGRYLCVLTRSPRFGEVYTVLGVPGRDSILIHSANIAGDVELGYGSDLLGCIGLGQLTGTKNGPRGQQLAVLVSRPAVSAFRRRMNGQPFELEIRS